MRARRIDALLLSCEHGGNQIPDEFEQLFQSKAAQRALDSHRGHDPGALVVATALKPLLDAPLFASCVSRLLVDLNRSAHHPKVFSEFSAGLGGAQRGELLATYYEPHRAELEQAIAQRSRSRQRTLHLAIHSFTPRLGGETRTAELGLLYDPQRPPERELCAHWKRELSASQPSRRVRCNYPYRGNADGLTTALRKRFSADEYLGIEVELNQALAAQPQSDARALAQWLANSLQSALASTTR